MTIDSLIAIFGWMTVINIGLLIFSTIILLACKSTVISIHSKLTGLSSEKLESAYFYYLSVYKILIIVFNLVPYLVLNLI